MAAITSSGVVLNQMEQNSVVLEGFETRPAPDPYPAGWVEVLCPPEVAKEIVQMVEEEHWEEPVAEVLWV